MHNLPSYVWALVLDGVIGIPAATCAGLRRGATGIHHREDPVGPLSILSSERVADTETLRYAIHAFVGSD